MTAPRRGGRRPESFELNEGALARFSRIGALAALFCVVLFIGWMVVTPVDEIAKAQGAVEPVSEVQRLQSEFGGSVAAVLVRRGDLVQAGDVLVVFDRSELTSQLREARVTQLSLRLRREHLLALVEKREPDFGPMAERARLAAMGLAMLKADDGDLVVADDIVRQLIQRETAAFESRRAYLANARQVVESQIAAKEADLAAVAAERPALERQLAVAKEEVAVLQELLDRGLGQRPRFVEAVEEEASFEYQLATPTGRDAVLAAQVEELRRRLEEIDLDEAARIRAEVSRINADIQIAQEQVVRLLRRVSTAELRAPVSGFAQSVPDTVVGRFIEPGGLVAEIVPRDVALRFAARLQPRDVGFVSPGQSVNLKIDAFDFSRYGALSGQVTDVSPTTIVDDRGAAWYEVLVDIPTPYYRDDPERFSLLPGMTGEADILIGKKTIFEYVWKPIYTNLDVALSER